MSTGERVDAAELVLFADLTPTPSTTPAPATPPPGTTPIRERRPRMIDARDLGDWLSTLPPGTLVGVDDDGLTLCTVTGDGAPMAPHCEVGGLPSDIDPDTPSSAGMAR
jgi:hypothetical protein